MKIFIVLYFIYALVLFLFLKIIKYTPMLKYALCRRKKIRDFSKT